MNFQKKNAKKCSFISEEISTNCVLHALDMKKRLAVHFQTVFIQFAVTKLVAMVSLVILWKPY